MATKATAERKHPRRPKPAVSEQSARPAARAGIEAISIRNFRCFDQLNIEGCARINVVVGDNGAGKTALFEAIFLALSGNPEVSLRLRSHRGLDLNFAGSQRSMEEAVWRDYFHGLDWDRSIEIALSGVGAAARSLNIARSTSEQLIVPLQENARDAAMQSGTTKPLEFSWTDASKKRHVARARITPQGVEITAPSEDLPTFFLFPAHKTVGAAENATRFSDLSRNRRERAFVERFIREYPWIEDLSIEVLAGQPVIHATMRDLPVKLPINMVSGGINRILGIMLALATRPNTVVIVDEIENGLYFKHKPALWRNLIELAREQSSQIFVSTHDEEWIDSLVEVAGDEVSDLALFRLQRGEDGRRTARRIPGRLLKGAVESGGEVR